MNWFQVLIGGVGGWFAREYVCDQEVAAEEANRDLWLGRAYDAAIELEEQTGSQYDWPDERLDD